MIVGVTGQCDQRVALIAGIPDSQLTGTGFGGDDPVYGYSRSRLNTQRGDDGNNGRGAWSVDENTVGEYIQADFGQLQRIQMIATQGRADWSQWVTSYKLAYSTDNVTYHYITRANGCDRVFSGNSDKSTVVEHSFNVILARFVRLYPQTHHGHMALRWELYGCIYNGKAPEVYTDAYECISSWRCTCNSI